MTVLDDCEALKTFEEIYECTNREGQAVLYIKLKGSSDPSHFIFELYVGKCRI